MPVVAFTVPGKRYKSDVVGNKAKRVTSISMAHALIQPISLFYQCSVTTTFFSNAGAALFAATLVLSKRQDQKSIYPMIASGTCRMDFFF